MADEPNHYARLANHIIETIVYLLQDQQAFFPVAAIIAPDGELRQLMAQTDEANPPSQLLIDLFENEFAHGSGSGQYQAVALGVDVLITYHETGQQMDAIQIRMDSRDRPAMNIIQPYVLHQGAVHLGTPYTERASLFVFG